MRRLRIAASWSRSIASTASPASQQRPLVGWSRQPIRFMNVDLPEPLGPITATNSPGITVSVRSRSAWTVPPPTS